MLHTCCDTHLLRSALVYAAAASKHACSTTDALVACRAGFDKHGYDIKGLDKTGHDKEGFNLAGLDR